MSNLDNQIIKPVEVEQSGAVLLLAAMGAHGDCFTMRFRTFLDNHAVNRYTLAEISEEEMRRLARAIDFTLAMPE